MTRIGRRLIEDFLLPALHKETYGDLLRWIDRDKGYFCIRWSHKNAAKWTLADTAVFQDWDKLKGHYRPEEKGYYMQAKQRFRAALYKLNTVRKLPCEDKHVKKYQLVLKGHKHHHEIMPRKPHRYAKEGENQKSIPTPVICRNTSFIAKAHDNFIEESSSLSSPPTSPSSSISIKSEVSDKEELECLEEYQLAREKQLLINYKHPSLDSNSESMDCLSAVLRESPQINNIRRTPHVPIQPVPVYSKGGVRQAMIENSQKRVESPHVLLVRTYNDSDTEAGGNQEMKIKDEPIIEEECNGNAENQHDLKNTEVALNLSTKCEDRDMLSR